MCMHFLIHPILFLISSNLCDDDDMMMMMGAHTRNIPYKQIGLSTSFWCFKCIWPLHSLSDNLIFDLKVSPTIYANV